MYRIRRQPPVDGKLPRQLLYHGELPTRLDSLHGQCDPIFPLYWDEQHSISLNSAIYIRIYCRAKYFAREFILGQRAFRFSRKVAPENFWHFFIELWNDFFITEPTTSTQARTRIARMGVGTLNQSTSRDGYEPRGNKKVIIPPGAHLPNRDMASRHSAGYSLLNGQELVLEHEYAGEVRHMR